MILFRALVKKKKGAKGAKYQKARKYVIFGTSKRVQKRCKKGAKHLKKGAEPDFFTKLSHFYRFFASFQNTSVLTKF